MRTISILLFAFLLSASAYAQGETANVYDGAFGHCTVLIGYFSMLPTWRDTGIPLARVKNTLDHIITDDQTMKSGLVAYRSAVASTPQDMADWNAAIESIYNSNITSKQIEKVLGKYCTARTKHVFRASDFNDLLSKSKKSPTVSLAKKDAARGYKRMSFTDFQLDAKSIRTGKKLSISGYYEVNGHIQSLTEKPSQIQMPNAYKLLLLSEDAPRYMRKILIELQNKGCGQYFICPVTVLGHVQPCSETILGKKVRDTICLAVDDVREGRD